MLIALWIVLVVMLAASALLPSLGPAPTELPSEDRQR